MKKLMIGLMTLISLSAFARGPHHHDQEMSACLDELRGNQEMSQDCKDFFQKKEERRAKLKECMAAIDNDSTSTTTTTTSDNTTDTSTDTDTTSDSTTSTVTQSAE